MYKDQDMKWQGQFPYDVLGAADITPFSTIREIQNCMDGILRKGKARETHKARNLLMKINYRLFYDFFFYRESLHGTVSNEIGTKIRTDHGQKEKEQ